ncbi:Putative integral membrane protein [Gloeomargarita lithophora Alchichica-D10]|uniref:Integral membrane protein n=1 Tax=Gloeomargarita lithophora Alchichica-D10 TaxID=1188229 RepID=A0A1J0AH17_9CYAN|nr:hypothetical protein [Gloeomargarita lithophora]APB35192.1 Putative integral membrane protein [Gloeomargarita lithophora Alchichica-D10]
MKPWRWLVWLGVLAFLGQKLGQSWGEVQHLPWQKHILAWWLGAGLVTTGAHLWAGWLWGRSLGFLGYPVPGHWAMPLYVRTNLAKYIPGNVWHFYGRIQAAQTCDIPARIVIVSILLEALLLAATALILGVTRWEQWLWPLLALLVVLLGIHPYILNRVLAWAGRRKGQETVLPPIRTYPLALLLGALGFMGLRGLGFLCVLGAWIPLTGGALPHLLGGFGLAWLMGFIVPLAPGGLGVFEATLTASLAGIVPTGVLLAAAVGYRLVSILAEVAAAGVGTWVGWGRRDLNPHDL